MCVCVCVCVCVTTCHCIVSDTSYKLNSACTILSCHSVFYMDIYRKLNTHSQCVLYFQYFLNYIVEYHLSYQHLISNLQSLFLSCTQKAFCFMPFFALFHPFPSIPIISAFCFSQELSVKNFLNFLGFRSAVSVMIRFSLLPRG